MNETPSPHRRRSLAIPPLPWLAILLVAGAVILGALAVAHLRAAGSEPTRYVVGSRPVRTEPAPPGAQAELARCRAQTQAEDTRCAALWEERRRKFFDAD